MSFFVGIPTLSSIAGRSNRPIWSQENLQNGSSFGFRWVWFRLYLKFTQLRKTHADDDLDDDDSHVPSKVAKPDVIASVGKEKTKGFSSISNNPVSRRAKQPMLEKKYFENAKLAKLASKLKMGMLNFKNWVFKPGGKPLASVHCQVRWFCMGFLWKWALCGYRGRNQTFW